MIPADGETVPEEFRFGLRRKGANQAIAAGLVGGKSDDRQGRQRLFGEATIRNLYSFGIDTTNVQIVEVLRPRGIIFLGPDGQNRIPSSGTNDCLTRQMSTQQPRTCAASIRSSCSSRFRRDDLSSVRFARAHKIRMHRQPARPGRSGNSGGITSFRTNGADFSRPPVRTIEDAADVPQPCSSRGRAGK